MKFIFIFCLIYGYIYCDKKTHYTNRNFKETNPNFSIDTKYYEEIDKLKLKIQNIVKDYKFQINLSDEVSTNYDRSFHLSDIIISNFTFPDSYLDRAVYKVDENNILIVKIDKPFKFNFQSTYKKHFFRILKLEGENNGIIEADKLFAKVAFKPIQGDEFFKTELINIYLNTIHSSNITASGIASDLIDIPHRVSDIMKNSLSSLIESKLDILISSNLKKDKMDVNIPFQPLFYINSRDDPIKLFIKPIYVNLGEGEKYSVEYKITPMDEKVKYIKSNENPKNSINIMIKGNQIDFYDDFFTEIFNHFNNKEYFIDLRLHNTVFDLNLLSQNITNKFGGISHGVLKINKLNSIRISDNKFNSELSAQFELHMKGDKNVKLLIADINSNYTGAVVINKDSSKILVKVLSFDQIHVIDLRINPNYSDQIKLDQDERKKIDIFLKDSIMYLDNVVIGYLPIKNDDNRFKSY